jgi:hypothetical protein
MKSYVDEQHERAVATRDELFNDPGGGEFHGHHYDFVLQNAELNLWKPICEDALKYFPEHCIPWHVTGDKPLGHLLSSQIACVNHLFPLRQNEEWSTALLQGIDSKIVKAVKVEGADGYVDFEVVGRENYLGEKSHSRGENSTSIDALMVGEKADGGRIMFPIEWKYTEHYAKNSLYIKARTDIYNPLLEAADAPVKFVGAPAQPFEPLYYEPFYQLMRQTLLSWLMVKAGEYGCSEYIHIHAVPDGNNELRDKNPSPILDGKGGMESAWKSVLAKPERYKLISPDKLFAPLEKFNDAASLLGYLQKRYW